MKISQECSVFIKRYYPHFLRSFRTVDKTWIHHYTSETKQQSKHWFGSGESAPKKAKMVPFAGKLMITVYFDSDSVVPVGYQEKDSIFTG